MSWHLLVLLLLAAAQVALCIQGTIGAVSQQHPLTAPLGELVRRYFPCSTLLVVSLLDNVPPLELVLGLCPRLVVNAGGVRLLRPTAGDLLYGRAQGYLITSNVDLLGQVALLRQLPSWNSTARFLVAADHDTNVSHVFAQLASVFITDVLLVVEAVSGHLEMGDADAEVALLYRDQTPACQRRASGGVNVTLVGRWLSRGLLDTLVDSDSVFPLPSETTLAGCTIRLAINPGPPDRRFDYEVGRQTMRMLGVTVEIKMTDGANTDLMNNGSWTGLLGKLQRREADVGLVGPLDVATMQVFRPSALVVGTHMRLWLHCSVTGSPALLITTGDFLQMMAILVIAMALLCTFVLMDCSFARIRRQGRRIEAVHVFSVFMEQPVFGLWTQQRLLFGLLLYTALLINLFFKSVITAELSHEHDPPRLEKLTEVSHTGLSIGIFYPRLYRSLRAAGEDHSGLKQIGPHLHLCFTNMTDCLARFKRDSSYAMAASQMSFLQNIINLKICIYPLRERLQYSQLVMYTRLDDPLGPLVDRALGRLHAAGLVEHCVRFSFARGDPGRRRAWRRRKVETVTLQNAKAARGIALGYIVAGFVFICELATAPNATPAEPMSSPFRTAWPVQLWRSLQGCIRKILT